MTAQQRDMIDQILRDAPFDLGGDVATQRPLLDQMLTSHPLSADVRMTPGDLGGIPVIFIDIADVEAFVSEEWREVRAVPHLTETQIRDKKISTQDMVTLAREECLLEQNAPKYVGL